MNRIRQSMPFAMKGFFSWVEYNELADFALKHSNSWEVSAEEVVLLAWYAGEIQRNSGGVISWEMPRHKTKSGKPVLFSYLKRRGK